MGLPEQQGHLNGCFVAGVGAAIQFVRLGATDHDGPPVSRWTRRMLLDVDRVNDNADNWNEYHDSPLHKPPGTIDVNLISTPQPNIPPRQRVCSVSGR